MPRSGGGGLWQVIKFAACVACLAHWQACAWFGIHVLQVRGGGQTWVELLAENQGQCGAAGRRVPVHDSRGVRVLGHHDDDDDRVRRHRPE